ncbi:nucleotidyltransferase domain protein [archaeon BMS3Abin17]|nr:nucleotidyltransferase domain protein [archaeon BMS3Abin17]
MLFNRNELKILEEFGGDYSKKNYGRAIAKKLGFNQKTVSSILIKLEKENILKFEQEGKNKYYFFNKLNPNIKDVTKIIELNKKIKFLNKHRKIKGLFDGLEQKTDGVLIIFGSYAKNQENKDSDLDVFVIGNIKDKKDLEDIYNIKINIVKTKKEYSRENALFKEIMKDHIILKGIEEFVNLIKW